MCDLLSSTYFALSKYDVTGLLGPLSLNDFQRPCLAGAVVLSMMATHKPAACFNRWLDLFAYMDSDKN